MGGGGGRRGSQRDGGRLHPLGWLPPEVLVTVLAVAAAEKMFAFIGSGHAGGFVPAVVNVSVLNATLQMNLQPAPAVITQ